MASKSDWFFEKIRLNHDIINEIAEFIDINSEVYRYSVLCQANKPTLLVFKPKNSFGMSDSYYVLNLRTLEPICESLCKTPLPEEIKEKMKIV